MYRFEIPLRGMIARSWCSANVYRMGGGQLEFAADNPFLIQRFVAFSADMVGMLRRERCRFIHDIDDLLWDVPPDNPGRAALVPHLLANMDASLRLADLVTTTTEPLAAALEQRGIPAVIIPNVLDPLDWQLLPKRAERSRLRVGWYGQRNVHIEDLNLLENVIAALARDVDFVFYGDIPRGLLSRQAGLEIYPGTAIELFPSMLAMLDLDIVLSPLVKNAFNECKSNLRLLQAGILGYAAIATDIEPHRKLPVTVVENTPAAWIQAIRERIGEFEAVRAEGERLAEAVHERYMLDDRWAERIFTTWTGRYPNSAG